MQRSSIRRPDGTKPLRLAYWLLCANGVRPNPSKIAGKEQTMNATNKAWYWVAAGVLALGLNGYYHDGGLQGLHRLANNVTSTVAETKAQFSQVAMLADVAMTTHARILCPRATPNTMVAVNAAMPPQAAARLADWQVR